MQNNKPRMATLCRLTDGVKLVMDRGVRCRACLRVAPGRELHAGARPLRRRLALCSGLKIKPNDGLPTHICNDCLSEMKIAYRFRKKCAAAELEFRRNLVTLDKDYGPVDENVYGNNDFNSGSIEEDNSEYELVIDEEGAVINNIKSDSDYEDIPAHETNSLDEQELSQNEIDKWKKSSFVGNELKPKVKNKRNHIKKPRPTYMKIKRKNLDKHMCTTCGKTFQFESNLSNHERVHSGIKPHVCKICNKSFTQLGHLSVHQRTHSGVKPYKCDVCNRSFTISQSLKKHMRTHTGERPYVCNICGKTFVTTYSLSNHNKRHIGEKNFKCDWPDCPLEFINISEMKSHKARHEKPPKNPAASRNHSRFKSLSILSMKGLSSKLLESFNK